MIKIVESNKRSKIFVIPDDTEMTEAEYMTSDYLDNDQIAAEKIMVKALGADPEDLYIITPDSYEGDLSSLNKLADAYTKYGKRIPNTPYKLYSHQGNKVAIINSEGSYGIVATKESFDNISNLYTKIGA